MLVICLLRDATGERQAFAHTRRGTQTNILMMPHPLTLRWDSSSFPSALPTLERVSALSLSPDGWRERDVMPRQLRFAVSTPFTALLTASKLTLRVNDLDNPALYLQPASSTPL